MGTIPTTPTFVSGDVLTAADLNSVCDVINFWADPPRCSVYDSAYWSHTSGTWKLNTWDSEFYDTDSMHSTSTNNSRITIQTDGIYVVQGWVTFAANTTGVRAVNIRVNSAGSQTGGTSLVTTYSGIPTTSHAATCLTYPREYTFTAGDYVEQFSYQNSGSSNTPSAANLAVRLVGPT